MTTSITPFHHISHNQLSIFDETDLVVGLDFETFSPVNLKDTGLGPYFDHPDTKVLIGCAVFWYEGRKYGVTMDFVEDFDKAKSTLIGLLGMTTRLCAHNAAFEVECLKKLGLGDFLGGFDIVDTAMIARMNGASSSLAASSVQLLNREKMDEGKDLIKLFSIPNKKFNLEAPTSAKLLQGDHTLDWRTFGKYCLTDADLSLALSMYGSGQMPAPKVRELANWRLTYEMNSIGWPVNLSDVNEMQRQYLANCASLIARFRDSCDPGEELNLNSPMQLVAWCKARGVRTKSFDQQAVEKLYQQVLKELKRLRILQSQRSLTPAELDRQRNLQEVRALLLLKMDLGGSSLKKLPVILAQTVATHHFRGKPTAGRLRHQYLHQGAGQTGRTSGRGVQMQNLARQNEDTIQMDQLFGEEWTNSQLAHSIRQVFQAATPDDQLIVADFSAIESRGLAWLAGERWKLDTYASGKDIYKMLATKFLPIEYADVTKQDRQLGKVGELSCGYGAGPGAVKAFAEKMGVTFTEYEAATLVSDWRRANPRIVEFWAMLYDHLRATLCGSHGVSGIPFPGGVITFRIIETPESLLEMNLQAQSIEVTVNFQQGNNSFSRIFHGCHFVGRNVVYYRASDSVNGKPWSNMRAATATAPAGHFTLYGGKIAGILTQSLCRELFFAQLRTLERDLPSNARIIGQFHDEVVVEYRDGKPWPEYEHRREMDLDQTLNLVRDVLSTTPFGWDGFPIDATVEHDNRYTK